MCIRAHHVIPFWRVPLAARIACVAFLWFDITILYASFFALINVNSLKVNGRWGFIDKTGNLLIRSQYLNRLSGPPWKPVSPLIEFHEGLAVVGTETSNAYINRRGEIIIAPAFLWYGSFAGGLASVFDGRQTVGYIDKQGKYVWRLNLSKQAGKWQETANQNISK